MNKEFVPYELAVKLKELGFDEQCLGLYEEVENEIKLLHADSIVITYLLNTANHEKRFYHCKSPLWQQAFDWLWNKTNKYIIPIPNDDKEWLCLGRKFKTYQEARQACLEKLIELVEQK